MKKETGRASNEEENIKKLTVLAVTVLMSVGAVLPSFAADGGEHETQRVDCCIEELGAPLMVVVIGR